MSLFDGRVCLNFLFLSESPLTTFREEHCLKKSHSIEVMSFWSSYKNKHSREVMSLFDIPTSHYMKQESGW